MVSNHDELMCNFFAQADALATGKTPVELRAGNVPDSLIPHKTFTGNRPSTSILLPELTAYTVGQILSLYENRIAVQVRAPSVRRKGISLVCLACWSLRLWRLRFCLCLWKPCITPIMLLAAFQCRQPCRLSILQLHQT